MLTVSFLKTDLKVLKCKDKIIRILLQKETLQAKTERLKKYSKSVKIGCKGFTRKKNRTKK